MESPLLQISLLFLTGYVLYLWISDYRSHTQGENKAGALPGATGSSMGLVWTGIAGALLLVGLETAGEYLLGVSAQQSKMTVLLGLVTLAAGFGEELIFRGYLVVLNRGIRVLWMSVGIFSLLFALLHPYLWSWEEGSLNLQLDGKAWFSTSVVFLNSLWFYWLRFTKRNETRSLLPCIWAHTSSNLAVFLVKLAQGHVSGLA